MVLLWLGLLFFYLLSWSAIPHLLLLDKRPAATLSWLLALLFFPPSLFLYLLIGTDRLRRQRLARFRDSVAKDSYQEKNGHSPGTAPALERVLETLADFNWTQGNNPIPFTEGEPFYNDLLQSIESARESILMQFYVWRNDQRGIAMRDALVRAAKRGVNIYLLVDELGSIETKSRFFLPLQEAGGQFSWFYTVHPKRNRYFVNLRNHRKISCFDYQRGYIGGLNVGLEYESKDPETGKWLDLHLRIEGPAVHQLASVFANDWYFSTQEKIHIPDRETTSSGENRFPAIVVESGPDQRFARNHLALSAMAAQASETLDFFTPYFVPTPEILQQMKLAALRGVRVRLLICQTSDIRFLIDIGRSYYRELLECGVRIFEFPDGVHHAIEFPISQAPPKFSLPRPIFNGMISGDEIEFPISNIDEVLSGGKNVNYEIKSVDLELNINQAIPCALIINEVVTNIYKHALSVKQSVEVHIDLQSDGKEIELKITDSGPGLPEGFDPDQTGSLGMNIIQVLSSQLGAETRYESSEKGTTFRLTFLKRDIPGIGSAKVR